MNNLFDKPKVKKIIFNSQEWNKNDFNKSVDNLAIYLSKNIRSNSPFIYLFASNHIKTIISYFAIIKAGYIVVLIDPNIKFLELNEYRKDTPPSVEICIKNSKEQFDYEEEIIFHYYNIDVDEFTLADVCTLVYTAAEDGYAKAAMLTRENLYVNACSVVECAHVNQRSVSCALLPFNHLFGLQTGVFGPIVAESDIVIEDISNLFKLNNFFTNIIKYNISHIYSVPLIYDLFCISKNIDNNFKNVYQLVSGGYKLLQKTYDRFFNKTGKHIQEGYGLTEASPICTWHRPGDEIKIESVGRAFSCCNVHIVDELGNEKKENTIGELCVQGKNVMKGYYNQKKATDTILKNDRLYTGDLGKVDKDGYIYFTGLKKDMYNNGGKNVYPKEIKRLIKINPNVEDIRINRNEHKIIANIKLFKDSEEERIMCKNWIFKNISAYKIPKKIYFNKGDIE